MLKVKFFKYIYLLLIVILIFINSCSNDDPITPPPIDTNYSFDSSRYTWTRYNDNSYFSKFDSFGDSTIYLLGYYMLRKFDGLYKTDYSFFDNDLFAISMAGTDNNNIYLGGSDINDKPKFLRFDGNGFENILIKDTTNRKYQISSIYIINKNNLYLGSTRGDLIYYDNGYFNFYKVDSTFQISVIGLDDNSNVYCVGQKAVFKPETHYYVNVYRLDPDWNWQIVFSESYGNNIREELRITTMNSKILGIQNNMIKKFIGNSFTEAFNDFPFEIYPLSDLSDTSFNSLLMPGTKISSSIKLFQWNGSKWSKELDLNELNIFNQFIIGAKHVKDKYYFLSNDELDGNSNLFKGVKK